MKKYLVLILSVIAAFAAMISLTACEAKVDKDGNVTITDGDKSNDDSNGGSGGGSQGNQDGKGGETPKHSHTFNKQVATEPYLKSAATCTAKAVYYYSCKCGEKGTQTFEYGEILPHEFNNAYICTNCSYKCKSDGLGFELSTDNNSYVCTGLGTFDGKILIIPSVYNGKPVTKIEEDAFKNATDITDVLIPDSVTEVGFNAFGGCRNLTKMVLPFVGAYADGSGDENIGYIFGASNCWKQREKLPSALKTIILSDKVTSIGGGAFYGCGSIATITIPNSLLSIGSESIDVTKDFPFYECNLNIYYGGSVDEWVQIENLFYLMGGVGARVHRLYINGELLTKAVINKAAEIKGGAFLGCTSLTNVIIGDSVTSIGRSAFSGCSSLASVIIGDSVTSIGSSAFGDCTSLTSVTIGKSVVSIAGNAFENCTSLEFNKYDNGLYLGNGTNKYLVLVKPKTYGIKNITINDGCKIIIDEALRGCSSLTSVTIGNSVTSIGSYAFCYCSSLTNVTIGDSVTSIGGYAFEGCRSLKTINYKGSKEQWNAISKGSYWDFNTGSYTINYNYVEN